MNIPIKKMGRQKKLLILWTMFQIMKKMYKSFWWKGQLEIQPRNPSSIL